MAATLEGAETADNFKGIFKKYKRRDQKLELSQVIDISTQQDVLRNSQIVICVPPAEPSIPHITGLQPVQQWKIYHFLQHQGFYIIKNPFMAGSQRYWVSRCLQDLPQPPNVTNLRIHPDLDPSTLWTLFQSSCNAGKTLDNNSPVRKLRWTTIGYHYDWDTKEYREETRSPFPEDLGLLARYVCQVLGFSDLQPQAGIINYYHLDSTLGAHTDHSELNHQAPLVSVSFGQDAIFLIGGQTKATTPTAVLLHSGDICVMSGQSRLAYHAVPRILPPVSPDPQSCFELSTTDLHKLVSQSADQSEDSASAKNMWPRSRDKLKTELENNQNIFMDKCAGSIVELAEMPKGSEEILTKEAEGSGDKPEGSEDNLNDKPDSNRDVLIDKPDSSGNTPTHEPKVSREIQADVLEDGGNMLTGKPEVSGEILTNKPEEIRDQLPEGNVYMLTDKPVGCEKVLADKSEVCVELLTDKTEGHAGMQRCIPENCENVLKDSFLCVDALGGKQQNVDDVVYSSHRRQDVEDTQDRSNMVTHHCDTHSVSQPADHASRQCSGIMYAAEHGSKRARYCRNDRHGPVGETHCVSTEEMEDVKAVKELNRSIVEALHSQNWQPFAVYMASSRLNVNIRQVLPHGQSFLSATHT